MSPQYLSSHFHEKTGKTLSSYINEMKINEAMRLLKTDQLSLAEISAALGYSSQNYFHKVFQNLIGMTPNEYRANQLL